MIQSDGSQGIGSGYLVSRGWVLTAAHVINDSASIRAWVDPQATFTTTDETTVDMAGIERVPEVDWALIPVPDHVPPNGYVPVVFGQLDRESTEPVHVVTLGLPWFRLRDDPTQLVNPQQPNQPASTLIREVLAAGGKITPAGGQKTGTLTMNVAGAPDAATQPAVPTHPQLQPGPPAQSSVKATRVKSVWEGMSGAAVWADSTLIGVVVRHELREGKSSLTVHPVPDPDPKESVVKGLRTPVQVRSSANRVAETYRRAAGDIAPELLSGRADEIAALEEFAVGKGRWWWWSAEAFAGKTALTAWWVACRDNPDVAVVACFLRRAARRDTAEHVIQTWARQLGALAGREKAELWQLGKLAADEAGIAELQELIEDAARHCSRLVLVVDGLDEYSPIGTVPVAEWLPDPQTLPDGAALLVTSRKGAPHGVLASHPLHQHVHPLALSPVAAQIREQAEAEINDAARREHAELDRRILGFCAAADGPLTSTELATVITRSDWNADPSDIDAVWENHLARTLTHSHDSSSVGSAAGGSSVEGYVFSHDALQDSARHKFADDLPRRREILHQWAAEYAAQGWPANTTPGYLLHSYPRMLAEQSRLGGGERLVRLALNDAFRQAQLNALPDRPDLTMAIFDGAIVYAAAQREVHVVGELLLSHAAHIDAARYARTPLDALRAGSLPEARRRAALFAPVEASLWTLLLAADLVASEQTEAAIQLLTELEQSHARDLSHWQAQWAGMCLWPIQALSAPIFDTLRRRLLDGNESDAVGARSFLADRLVDDGAFKPALACIESLGGPSRNPVLLHIARQLAERGDEEDALEWARAVTPRRRVEALAVVAHGLADAGRDGAATRLFEMAKRTAERSDNREWSLAWVATEQAGAGWFPDAGATASVVDDPFARSYAWLALATAQSESGSDSVQALAELRYLADAERNDTLTARLATAYWRTGDHDAAAAAFAAVLARVTKDSDRSDVVRHQLEAGDVDGAQRSLDTIKVHTWREIHVSQFVQAWFDRDGLAATKARLAALTVSQGTRRHALVDLAVHVATAGAGHDARTLLALAMSIQVPAIGSLDATGALQEIAQLLADRNDIADAAAVIELLPVGDARWVAWPGLATALVRAGQPLPASMIDDVDDLSMRDEVCAAVAAGMESVGRHSEAMTYLALIKGIRPNIDAVVEMGRQAAAQGRYLDAWACLAEMRIGSLTNARERDSVVSAIACGQCRDSDPDAALETVERLSGPEAVARCLTEMCYIAPNTVTLDRIGNRSDALAPLVRLAPLAALVTADRRLGRAPDRRRLEAETLAALRSFLANDAPDRSRDQITAAAPGLAQTLDELELGELARRVRRTACQVNRKEALKGICLTYARAGRPDMARWALDQMEHDFARAEVLCKLLREAPTVEFSDRLVALGPRLRDRTWVTYIAGSFADAGDWDRLALLLLPGSETRPDAYRMCVALAAFSSPDAKALARLIDSCQQPIGHGRGEGENGAINAPNDDNSPHC